MTRTSKTRMLIAVLMLLTVTRSWSQTSNPLPSAEDIIARMAARDAERHALFSGYAVSRRYEVVNKHHHAEMLVRVVCTADGGKQFSIQHEEGSGFMRNHVLRKMLEEETNASDRETRGSTRIVPENYSFEMVGTDMVAGRLAYVLEIRPKNKSKYLIRGRIWVDATDYAIVRIEGSPARNPSFWTKSVHFVHTYRKVGELWLAASTRSVTEVRIFGTAELSISDFDYSPAVPQSEARLGR